MARPKKRGLDYFPFDVDFFDDEKIAAISGEFGLKGEMTTVKLLCAIYRNGYFVLWDEPLKYKLLRSLPGVSVELIDRIIIRLVKWGFFDEDLFNSAKVLTSRGIQRRFFTITKRRSVEDDMPYILASTINNVVDNRVIACNNPSETQQQTHYCAQKVHKVKESRDNISSDESILSSSTTTTTARAQDVSTDESSLFSSPRSKEKSCAKKESDLCGLPPDNPAYIPIDRVADYLRGEQAWLESLCMNRHLRLDYVLSKIDEFGVELSLKGETVKDKRDCKSHFNNWLRKTSNRYERPPITQSDTRVDSDNLLRNCQERVAQRMARAKAREMGQHGVGVPDAL